MIRSVGCFVLAHGASLANAWGVGAKCRAAASCSSEGQTYRNFNGSYCGVSGCTANAIARKAPSASRTPTAPTLLSPFCNDKPDSNGNRTVENEANGVATVTFIEPATTGKVCALPRAPS